MKQLLDVPAPAKLNLFLHITGRRSDGYHLLQSVFMLIDWCDHLHFDCRTDGLVARDDLAGGDLPADDLCVRAARTLQQATGCTLGVQIGLDKRLPAQADRELQHFPVVRLQRDGLQVADRSDPGCGVEGSPDSVAVDDKGSSKLLLPARWQERNLRAVLDTECRIDGLDENFVSVEVADKVSIKVQRGAVTAVLPKGTLKSA